VPAIAVSGLTFYTGDRYPGWTNNLVIGGMREREAPRSGHFERIDFNDQWEDLHRERKSGSYSGALDGGTMPFNRR
jgi:aldose sugar dehydrogenase